MGQTNNHKSNFHFLILGCKSLQSITAWSLERIDITRHWVSSLVMLCQASTATVFSSCLFLGHFSFSFVFSKWNACSIGFRSGDWLGHCITFHFFALKNSLVAFTICFGSLSICTVKRRPFLDVVWQTLIWSSCFWGSPMVYILWWTLYSLWWSLLLIADFHTHTPTSWRVFLVWPTVVKGFFFTREIILLSSTTVVFRGLPGLLVLLSSRSFF